MDGVHGSDGCPAFTKTVELEGEVGTVFRWGVVVADHDGHRQWGIPVEVSRDDTAVRERSFVLSAAASGATQEELFHLNDSRRIGAQKYFRSPADPSEEPRIRFVVWAPNADSVEVEMGALWDATDASHRNVIDPAALPGTRAVRSLPRVAVSGGYIGDDGAGRHRAWGPFPMTREGAYWATDPSDPALARFTLFDHAPYMYRVTTDGGRVAYRSDLFSRCQIGYGTDQPKGPYEGTTSALDGRVSCSVVVDPDRVTTEFLEPVWPETRWTDQDAFFAAVPAHPSLAGRDLQDLVIYELHVGALGANRPATEPGNLADACALLDYLEDLGVNAVELLPLSEFGGGGGGWGYATSHYFAIEYSGGGRDHYKHFIRECHRRGIAVILDVVYNHYAHQAERAEWMYDTDAHERNAYYWYEGAAGQYPDATKGYVDNESSGAAPRYWEEHVRRMFVSSAIALAAEFQVDGFRVDQTTSIRSYNRLAADGRALSSANAFGAKLLRELTRSLRLVTPRVMLIAEDHSNSDDVTTHPDAGGLGFDAAWYADFYHHLIGDTAKGTEYAKLIKTAGLGDDRPLAMDYFAGALQASAGRKIVYHESHDEAGNGELTHRTIVVAANGWPLVGDTLRFAEARCRFAASMTLLSAGVPMFLFGEEVGAQKDFRYGEVLANREDLHGLRSGSGRLLFEFYRSLIRLRRSQAGLRSRNLEVVYVHNEHRLLAFRRWGGGGGVPGSG